jgi:hypothetical protein
MTGKAKKPTLKALLRWETEGGAMEDGPQTPKRRRPHDANQLSKSIVGIATGDIDDREPLPEEQGKDPCAVSLGHRGDLKGGKAQVASMTPTRRVQIAKAAAKARWNKR